MSDLTKQEMQDLAIYNDLITSLITLKAILEDIGKISIDLEINNKIKQLEAERNDELELLQEKLRIITLRNKFLGSKTKNKIDNIEKLKEEVKEQTFISVKILQDLNYEKYDEVFEIAKMELKLERLGT